MILHGSKDSFPLSILFCRVWETVPFYYQICHFNVYKKKDSNLFYNITQFDTYYWILNHLLTNMNLDNLFPIPLHCQIITFFFFTNSKDYDQSQSSLNPNYSLTEKSIEVIKINLQLIVNKRGTSLPG